MFCRVPFVFEGPPPSCVYDTMGWIIWGVSDCIKVLDVEGDPNSKIIEVNATISSEEANDKKFNELGLFDASNNKLTHITFDVYLFV